MVRKFYSVFAQPINNRPRNKKTIRIIDVYILIQFISFKSEKDIILLINFCSFQTKYQ